METKNKNKIASNGLLVHEWIETVGGAEKVLDQFREIFPDLDLLCLWNDGPSDENIRESVVSKTPLRSNKKLIAGLLPFIWQNTKLGDYDWALISTHLFAHHVASNRALRDVPTFAYVHTPARYIWSPELDGRGGSRIVRTVSPVFKFLDKSRAKNLTSIAANSGFVRDRIKSAWDLDSTIIYPPVEARAISSVENWTSTLSEKEAILLERLPENFLLGFSRLVEYKKLDVVLKVAQISGLPVVIAGSGPDCDRLKMIALDLSVPVFFLGYVSNNMLYALYQKALGLVFPAIEDFGIIPIEAMAAGLPVLTAREGGGAETVLDGFTGTHVDFQSKNEIRLAVDSLSNFSSQRCISRAMEFDSSVFRQKIGNWVVGS